MNRYRSLNSQRGYTHVTADNRRSLNSSFFNSDIADRVAYATFDKGVDVDNFEVFECEFKNDCLLATIYIGDHIGNEDQVIAYDVNENSSEADIEAAIKHVADGIVGHFVHYVKMIVWNYLDKYLMMNGIKDAKTSCTNPTLSFVENNQYAGIYTCDVTISAPNMVRGGARDSIYFNLNQAAIEKAVQAFVGLRVNSNRGSHRLNSSRHLPYQAISIPVILRDWDDLADNEYYSPTHKKLVDIGDTLYNDGMGMADYLKPEFKKLYDEYGEAFWKEVIEDAAAIDSQMSRDKVKDLKEELVDISFKVM